MAGTPVMLPSVVKRMSAPKVPRSEMPHFSMSVLHSHRCQLGFEGQDLNSKEADRRCEQMVSPSSRRWVIWRQRKLLTHYKQVRCQLPSCPSGTGCLTCYMSEVGAGFDCTRPACCQQLRKAVICRKP